MSVVCLQSGSTVDGVREASFGYYRGHEAWPHSRIRLFVEIDPPMLAENAAALKTKSDTDSEAALRHPVNGMIQVWQPRC